MYEYRARAVDIVDGDTIDIVVDLGFHITREIRLRLERVDTHETYGVAKDTDEYQCGARETEYVEDWLPTGDEGDWPLVVRTEKRGNYSPGLAKVERRADGTVLLYEPQDGRVIEPAELPPDGTHRLEHRRILI